MSAFDISPIDTLNNTLLEIQHLANEGPYKSYGQYQNLSSNIERMIYNYEQRLVATHDFCRVYTSLGQLNDDLDQQVEVIHQLFMRTHTIFRQSSPDPGSEAIVPTSEEDSGFFSYLSSLWSGIVFLTSKPVQIFCDLFVDGNCKWKMQKYALGLQGINQSFKENDIDLLQIKESYQTSPTPLRLKIIPIIDFLVRSTDAFKMRSVYQYDFILNLREILNSAEFTDELLKLENNQPYEPAVQLLLDIIYYRYTNIHIYFFCDQLVENLIHKGRDVLQKPYPVDGVFSLPLEEQLVALYFAPQEDKAPKTHIEIGKLWGASGYNFDPHGTNNMPFVSSVIPILQTDGSIKPVKNIRMGTATKCGGLFFGSPLEIIPEFDVFIRFLKKLEMKFVYFNLQTFQYQNAASIPELKRSETIVNLGNKYANFYPVCLPYDTDFYYQRNEYDTPSSREAFKSTLFHLMFDGENSGFHIPQSWKNDLIFHNQIIKIFYDTYYCLFNDKEVISASEKQIFIDVFYVLFIPYVLNYSGADLFTTACKDGLDRAGLNNYLLRLLILILNNKENDPEYKRIIDVSLHGPTLTVKKQEMNTERSTRLLFTMASILHDDIKARFLEKREEFFLPGLFDVKIDRTQVLWTNDPDLNPDVPISTPSTELESDCQPC